MDYPTTKKRSSSASYSVVVQDQQTTTGLSAGGIPATIGQIIGNGLQISTKGYLNGVLTTLFIRDDIQIEDVQFTMIVFAQYSGEDILVENCNVTKNGSKLSCTLFSDGTFFPAAVRPDWKTYIAPAITSPPSTSTGGSAATTLSLTTSSVHTTTNTILTSKSSQIFPSVFCFVLIYVNLICKI